MYLSLFCDYLPLEIGEAFLLNKLESQATKDALCQVKLKLAQWFLKKKIVFNFVSVFTLTKLSLTDFLIISPWIRSWLFI